MVPFIDSRELQTSCVHPACVRKWLETTDQRRCSRRSPNNGAYFATVELAFLPPRPPLSVKRAFGFCHEKQGIPHSWSGCAIVLLLLKGTTPFHEI